MLTAKKIARLGIGRYLDGGDNRGLYLQITARKQNGKVIEPPEVGGGSWLLRYERNGHERWMGLGSLAVFNLKEARQRARAARQLLADGIDPLDLKKAAKTEKVITEARKITFEKAARQWFDEKQATWRNSKHRDQVINALEQFAFPIIGSLPIESIDKGLVLKVLEQPYKGQRLWSARAETANRLRTRIELVLSWDAVRNDRKSFLNPARWEGHLEHVLTARSKIPGKKIKHHAALSYNDVGEFFADLRQREGIEAAALEFTILTAARTEQTIGATWGEFELRAVAVTTRDDEGHESTVMGPCWIVPKERMKSFKRHRIPLSDRAVEILKSVSTGAQKPDELVFGGLSDTKMWLLLTKTMGYSVTVHGFRSTFRDWAGDIAHHPPEATEKALAHGIKDKSEASYWRSDMFDKRRRLMADWARFCELPKQDTTVTPIRKRVS